ncbi:MAG: 4Fe-4S ferredoxin [Desulfobacula sp.]|jgi:ferredoxin|uniref:4Fe-4S ferredoxin n=1 Tax=Desulfobacula sp. TaxID=2593537 RepID=UPI001D5EE335|nr:4Fe-4S ferredoxin [Desulfobacula sp.]MBT3484415.1 4Fe-4S ferredoxin [Desulfobacula sp.]MBT3803330.1 4Fe-4S ferredoxin [Desulfobacula sp.]MBT4023704.1 4Fe-4S ferredoxin [Desulfobacula sp.]MBT4197946.1 4Fe-4S ferredoxin [Desulfobacula sp.]
MNTCINKIRELALELLDKKEVEKVIGFANGTIPLATSPIAITSKQDIEKLVFNSTCGLNLANYLRDQKGKIAVIAKGCDTRNIVTHIVENQIKRDQLFIIGVPCNGMIDQFKIAALFNDEIIEFSEDGDTLNIKSSLKEEKLYKKDYLRENCKVCMHKNPVIYDVLAMDLVEEQTLDNPYPDVDKIEAMDSDKKWQHFQDLTKNCIRCYACKNACPLCYCPTCFVDESSPQWVGKGQNKTDVNTFHYLRAFHCAGRCTDCGACVQACPMDINVRDFTRKLNKDSFEMFGWEAGLDITKRPPLDAYSPDDPDDFIK